MSRTETIITIVLAVALALCAVYLSTQAAPSVAVCYEDAAIVYFGEGQFTQGRGWDSYRMECVAVDNMMLD